MSQHRQTEALGKEELGDLLVRDLVDAYPSTMALLSPWGLDLCCGGGRKVGEALTLHGAPVDEVLDTIAGLVNDQSGSAAS
ncbi:MAG: hypothetical protein KF883_08870 [Thermomicrobiales bacterium]|nr:hypothetical protein [Thermomicrobiales bacterium]